MTKQPLEPCHILQKSRANLVDVAEFVNNYLKTHPVQFILLDGDIGAGKTTLVQVLANSWSQVAQPVVSPSFSKMLIYDKFVHLDAYNMNPGDLDQFGDFFVDKLVVIEWAQLLGEMLRPALHIEIKYDPTASTHRDYVICPRN